MSVVGKFYYNKLKQFLIYKGKKSRTERLCRELFRLRAMRAKPSILPALEQCKYNGTQVLWLKARGRGKRIIYRIHPLDRLRADKQSVSKFGVHIRNQNPEKLAILLEKEIETFAGDRNHPVRVQRDKVLQLGRQRAPASWFKRNRSKKWVKGSKHTRNLKA